MSDQLALLVEIARHIVMTPEELIAQEIDFAYGNLHYEEPRITREMVATAHPNRPTRVHSEA